MSYSLLLLFPAGIVVGWLLFDQLKNKKETSAAEYSADYFKGLNYLIDEEQDKAISFFTQMLEENPEMVETHLALGALFRRRGETSKAISIHKSLTEKTSLSLTERQAALIELGRDYMKAGMLDRATVPFEELLKSPEYQEKALGFLIKIYDQEQDWDRAIVAVKKLTTLSDNPKWRTILAHYWCEKAKQEMTHQNYAESKKLLDKALDNDLSCVRANILKAKSLQLQGEHLRALDVFKRIESQSPLYIPEILEGLLESYHKVADSDVILAYLHGLLKRNPSTSLILALVDKVRNVHGLKEAESLLIGVLQSRPSVRGLEFLIALNLDKQDSTENKIKLKSLKKMMAQLREEKPAYQCNHCGFQAQKLHWQCPGCRQWSSIQPILGVAGE